MRMLMRKAAQAALGFCETVFIALVSVFVLGGSTLCVVGLVSEIDSLTAACILIPLASVPAAIFFGYIAWMLGDEL